MFLGVFLLVSCVAYQKPPDVSLVAPESGTYVAGQPLVLEFSAAIQPETLVIQVWSGERDVEFEMTATEPILKDCSVDSSPCGATLLTVAEDGLSATLTFDVEGLGKPDVPYVLEISDKLTNTDGTKRGTSAWFDYQFKPSQPTGPPPVVPVAFTDGYYLLVAEVDDPMPTVLSLITHVIALDDGRVALVAVEADEYEGAPKGSLDPADMYVDTTDQGFAIFTLGMLRETPEGRFLETDPFDVNIAILGLQIVLSDTRLTGKLLPQGEAGVDSIEGILSYAKITLTGAGTQEYPAGSTQFNGVYIPEELIPEDSPQLCGALCGGLPSQCTPPDAFPGDDFCQTESP